jgi:hypothetical protein
MGATLQPIIWGASTNHGITPNDSTYGPSGLIQTVRTSYTITQNDVNNGYANIPCTFKTAYPDANYTLTGQTITQTGALDNGNDFSPGDNHLLTATGFTAQIYVNGSVATAGMVIVLHTSAIHD